MKSSPGPNLRNAITLLRGRSVAALSVALCSPALAAAQAAAAAPRSSADTQATDLAAGETIGEIIVTARKQSESLQAVPLAISVLSTQDIEAGRVFDVAKLGELVPGLVSGGSQQRGAPIIRGITTRTPEVGADSVVGQYVDEIYQPRITNQLTALFDLDHIEVLKGPQGTLYGRNTIGGVINYVTVKPNDALNAYTTFGAGNRNAYEARAGISGPIAADVAAGVSVMTRDGDGNIDVVNATGRDIGNNGSSDLGARAALRWTPNDGLEINASLWTLRLRGASLDMTNGNPAGTIAPIAAQLGLYTPSPWTDDNENYRIARTLTGRLDRTTSEAALRADWNVVDAITLTSLTAYQDYTSDLANDLDYDVQQVETFLTSEESHTFSQELRLAGGSEVFHWTLGGNYFYDNQIQTSTDDFTGLLPAPFPVSSTRVKTTSAALFGQTDLSLTKQLTLTTGVRYSYDARDYRKINADQLVGENFDSKDVPGWDTEPSWDNVSYLVSLDYPITPDILLYASYSTGYRSGGIQGRADSIETASADYDPEHAYQTEIGAKTTLFDGRVRLNVAAYDIDYEDAQINQIPLDSPFDVIRNAAGASMQGIEVEATVNIAEDLSAHVGYTYNDSHFTDYSFAADIPAAIAGVDAGTPGGCSPLIYGCSTGDYIFDGVPFEFAAEHAFLVGLDYEHRLGGGPRLNLHAEYAWKDDYLLSPMPRSLNALSTDFLDANFLRQPAYGLFNATASLQFSNNWSVGIWGRNLTDEHYVVMGGDPQPAFNGMPFNTFLLGDRRTYGVTLSWRYSQ